jgi:DNA-binding IclR family transcriptional regulator
MGEVALAAAVVDADGVPLGALHLSGSSSQWSGADYAKKFSSLLLNAIAQYERRNA